MMVFPLVAMVVRTAFDTRSSRRALLGAPAFVLLGGTALLLFWRLDQPIASIPIAHYSLVTNPTLPTLPLFTLAGYFLAEGNAPKRMVRLFDSLFGNMRGGTAVVV